MLACTRIVFSVIVVSAVLLLADTVQAKYVGGVNPICTTCNSKRPANAPYSAPSGTATSLAEGNMTEKYPGPSIKGSNGATVSLDFNYDSYNASGAHARVLTTMGVGWTHSYNVFLFKQRLEMFRFDGSGRVTKYTPTSSISYASTEGYFETLTRTPTGFVLTYKDQTRYDFALVSGSPTLDGLQVYWLRKISHPRGAVTTLNYSGGLLREIVDTYGRKLLLAYNAARRLESIADERGNMWTLQYDSTNTRLSAIIDPRLMRVTYSYDVLYQMTQKIDRDGRSFTFGYQLDKPLSSADAAGANLFSQTNLNNWATDESALATQLMRVYTPSTTFRTDGRGNVWEYEYDEHGYIRRARAPDGAQTGYIYDATTLQLSSVTDANGHSTRYRYDGAGNLMKVIDHHGNETKYTYENTFNQLTSMTDANNRVTTYEIDPANGNRLMETDPLLQTRRWTYDDHGNVKTEEDRRGNITQYFYDVFGNRVQTIDREGHTWRAGYDAVGNVLTRTDPLGHMTCYDYDGLNRLTLQREACGTVIEKATAYTYDGQGNRTRVVDANKHAADYEYDLRQRLTKTTDALPPPNNFSTQSYDGNDNRISVTDKNTHTTTFQYDGQNRLMKTIDALGFTSTLTYDLKGNKLTETDANIHTTTYAYDELDRMTTRIDAEGFVIRYAYDVVGTSICTECTGPTRGSSREFMQTDGNGKVTYSTYDGLDRVVKQIRKQGDTGFSIDTDDAVTTFGYDPNSNRASLTEPNTNATRYEYDRLNRQTKTTNAAGDMAFTSYDSDGAVHARTAPNLNVTTYTYDAQHRLKRIDDSAGPVATYDYDLVGNRSAGKDGNGNGPSYTYDAIYRVTGVTDALGKTTNYDYDPVGNLLTITDRKGFITNYLYDVVNRRVQAIDALGHIAKYQYDGVGNRKKIIDANNHATDYDYDRINRLTIETYADGGARRFEYDAANLARRTDQIGQVTTYDYTDLYFLRTRIYPVSPADNMTYDLSGRLLTAERGGWLVTFAYDGANRVVNTTQNTKPISYAYDIPGRKRMVTYPSGRTIVENTDPRSRLATIDDTALSSPLARYSYDPGNRVLTRSYRNGTTATYAYDPNNRTRDLAHVAVGGDCSLPLPNGCLAGFGHDYDDEDNKRFEQKRPDSANSNTKSEAYEYDDIHRLTHYKVGVLTGSTVLQPITQTHYDLDSMGNWDKRATDGTIETREHDAVNEITRIDVLPPGTHREPGYDSNGNLVDDNVLDVRDGYTYAYDEENRLTAVTRKSDLVMVGQYAYDALSRRVMKISRPAGVTTTRAYVYDNARIIEEKNGVGAIEASYVYGNYIDEVLTMDRGGSPYYYHQNALWSVEAVSDAAGAVVERYSYDAYGKPTVYNGAGVALARDASAIGNPWMFTGRELDDETGIYYYRARYYDPRKGRFLQRDVIKDSQNLLEYVNSNPVAYLDPYGLKKCCPSSFRAPIPEPPVQKVEDVELSTVINGQNFIEYRGQNVTAPFDVEATFGTDDPPFTGDDPQGDEANPCCCECCVYYQKLRGEIKLNGKAIQDLHGLKLSKVNWVEDNKWDTARKIWTGHYGRREVPGTGWDKYTEADQKTGCKYNSHDEPGSKPLFPGNKIEAHLEFAGEILDICTDQARGGSDVEVYTLGAKQINARIVASHTWKVDLDHTAKVKKPARWPAPPDP